MKLSDLIVNNMFYEIAKLKNDYLCCYRPEFVKIDKDKLLKEVMLHYQILRNKIIKERIRKVFFSKELAEQLENLEKVKVEAIYAIKTAFENGESVLEWQSKTIFDTNNSDSMLNEWGLYHFHLGMAQKKKDIQNGKHFRERSGKLLVAYIDEEKDIVYFLLVSEKHDKKSDSKSIVFARKRYLEVLDDNWPYFLKDERLNGIEPDMLTDEQRANLFKRNLNDYEEIHGKAILPKKLGQTFGGISFLDVRNIDVCVQVIREMEYGLYR